MRAAGSVYGYSVESTFPLSRLRDDPGPRGTVRVVPAADPLLDRPGELTAWSDDGFALARSSGALLAWCSVTGSFLIDAAGGRIHAQPADGTGPAWEHRLMAVAMPLLAAERGDLVLHASAVAADGRAVLFCGPAGRGKSTTAYSLAWRGFPLLAEDGAAVTIEAERAVAWPGPRGARVGDGMGAKRVHDTPGESKPRGAVPVAAVVVLAERGGGRPAVRLTPAAAVQALLPNAIHGGRDRLRQSFSLAARLAGLVPVYRASLPDDLSTAPAAATRLVEEVVSSARSATLRTPSQPSRRRAPSSSVRSR
jgi:hypothetical protein